MSIQRGSSRPIWAGRATLLPGLAWQTAIEIAAKI
jgi:hypothetical protein